MSKHTPGPWKVREVEEGHEILMGQASITPWQYPSHCKVEYYHDVWPEDGKQYDEAEANAHLIAAAPELLEALEDMHEAFVTDRVSFTDHQKNAIKKANAAISKAGGSEKDDRE